MKRVRFRILQCNDDVTHVVLSTPPSKLFEALHSVIVKGWCVQCRGVERVQKEAVIADPLSKIASRRPQRACNPGYIVYSFLSSSVSLKQEELTVN